MSIGNLAYIPIDFLRLPPPHGERRTDDAKRRSSTKSKSIYSPWGWGK